LRFDGVKVRTGQGRQIYSVTSFYSIYRGVIVLGRPGIGKRTR
jgi:hypothetical protein